MKKAIVLAGTLPHVAVINNLKRRGYETILVDFNPNCPARKYADRYVEESTLDREAVLRLAEEEKVDLVISIVGDHINAICCYVAEKLGLPHPYSYEAALSATRKSLMKPLFVKFGVPTSDFCVLDKDTLHRKIDLDFPLVVKPSDCNSSRGVFRVLNEDDLREKIDAAFSLSREGKVIVEEYVDGTEIHVDCMAINGKAHICMVKDLPNMPLDGKELQTSGYQCPGSVCSSNMDLLQDVSQKIINAYGLKTGAFFYQAKVNDRGLFVLEAAARMAGGATYESVCMCCDIDYVDLAISSFLGEPVTSVPKLNGKRFVGKFLNMKPGTFGAIIGAEELVKNGCLVRYWCYVNPGTEITGSNVSANRIATIMAECDSYGDGEEKIKKALEKISILDINGNDMSNWR